MALQIGVCELCIPINIQCATVTVTPSGTCKRFTIASMETANLSHHLRGFAAGKKEILLWGLFPFVSLHGGNAKLFLFVLHLRDFLCLWFNWVSTSVQLFSYNVTRGARNKIKIMYHYAVFAHKRYNGTAWTILIYCICPKTARTVRVSNASPDGKISRGICPVTTPSRY